MSMSKTSKLFQYIGFRIKVTTTEGKTLVGKFMAFDKHMNLVLGDCEEFSRNVPKGKKGEERERKRTLGLIILRGENIISLTIEGPPPQDDSRVKSILARGVQLPGSAQPAGRGITIPTTAPTAPMPGLTGPIQTPLVGMNPAFGRGVMPPPGFPGFPPGMPGRGIAPPPGMIPPPGFGRGILPPGAPPMKRE
ncbi:small nuclear ribonucleoprotein B and B' [Acrasis kona]|uniref:Sm protein B n=1 Tax=Acrasis kona TaxID=1008807 RepID=A0AAW2ZI65_9EUKA